jgi:beta-xylosidase
MLLSQFSHYLQMTMKKKITLLAISILLKTIVLAQVSQVWQADNGDGTYKNPIIHADYSDPDVIRVGDDYFMVSSSFNCTPMLPILHSKDLVNWTIINYVKTQQEPLDVFSKPQHGNGVWAPAIRYHKGEFYIFYPDPDFGIYRTKTKDPFGEWETPILIKAAKGWIDPCPFWDDDGKAYLVHGFAGSRAGFKSILAINRMDTEGSKLLDDGVVIFDGHDAHPTVEGPKIYKRNDFYYVFAPAGGVPTGWQLVLRSKNIYGPYDEKIVLAQGKTPFNGPHQGAWVDTPTGEDWFIHFQDKGAYGRVVLLEPMTWKNDFPIMGDDPMNTGTGSPVFTHKKPNVGKTYPKASPQESDEFDSPKLGLQWQWHANSVAGWAFPYPAKSVLRMNAVMMPDSVKNMWDVPNLLLQKLPAEEFTATTKLTFTPRTEGEQIGLIMMGLDYSFISLQNQGGKLAITQTTCNNADKKGKETITPSILIDKNTVYLRVKVQKNAYCTFSYSMDGKNFTTVGKEFKAREGKWIGAKVGLFCSRIQKFNDAGVADIDWFRVDK